MKQKNIFYSIVAITPFLLSSCEIWFGWGSRSRRTNSLFECFLEADKKDDVQYYFLKVTKITEQQFKEANGTNVVVDSTSKIVKKYFLFNFYSCKSNDPYSTNVEKYSFINLKDAHPSLKAEPIMYVDDNSNTILPSNKMSYDITYNQLEFHFFKKIST